MHNRKTLFTNVEWLGRNRFWEECVEVCGSPSETDWWRSLKFFFYHSFMRGRRDQLSAAYCQFTIEAIQELFQIDPESPGDGYRRLREESAQFDKKTILDFKQMHANTKGASISQSAFAEDDAVKKNRVISALITKRLVHVKFPGEKTRAKHWKLGNDEDLMMVLDVLDLVSCPERQNVYCYLKHLIESEGPQAAYETLVKRRGIGDKIATLIVRDIGILIKEADRTDWDYKFAFPVDTWVRKLAKKLGCDATKDEAIKGCLILKCKEYKVDPLFFAAGLWYLGSHAVNILIDDCLNSIELTSDGSGGSKA